MNCLAASDFASFCPATKASQIIQYMGSNCESENEKELQFKKWSIPNKWRNTYCGRITPPSILLLHVFPSRTFFIPPRFIDGERRRRLERGSNGQCGSLGNLQYWVPATTSLCTSITFNRYSVTSSDIRSNQKKYKFAVLGPRLFPVSSITPTSCQPYC